MIHSENDKGKRLTYALSEDILISQRSSIGLIVNINLTRFDMKKTYNIEIDCANCANLVERAVNKLDGVSSVVVNYMTQKMTVEFTDSANEHNVINSIIKTAKKIEPDFEVN